MYHYRTSCNASSHTNNPPASRALSRLTFLATDLGNPVPGSEPGAVESSSSTSAATSSSLTSLTLTCLALTSLTTLSLACLTTLTLACLTLTSLTLTCLASLTLTSLTSLALTSLTLTSLTLTLTTLALLAVVLASIVLASVVCLAAVASTNGEPDAVILGATLSNGHNNRGVVAGRGQRANTVDTIGKTSGEIRTQETVAISSIVDALEEGKGFGVEGVGWVFLAVQILDNDMGVADNLATCQRLRSRVVGNIRVREGSSLQVGNLDGECKRSVGSLVFTVLGINENGGYHAVGCGDISHDYLKLDPNDSHCEVFLPMPLQEPSRTCRPLVKVFPVQKLMKLAGSLGFVSIGKGCEQYLATHVSEAA